MNAFKRPLPSLTVPEKKARQNLRTMRTLATFLLILAAIGYLLASYYLKFYPALIHVKVFCEASMAGALADWFAVVSLFKHPLGLPIPHTAILPKNQARLAQQLGLFIETNFLDPVSLAQKLSIYQPVDKILKKLAKESSARNLLQIGLYIIENISAQTIDGALKALTKNQLSPSQLGSLAAHTLSLMQNKNYDDQLLDEVLKELILWLKSSDTRLLIEKQINHWLKQLKTGAKKSLWNKFVLLFKGGAADLVDGYLASKIATWLEETCITVYMNPNHFIRRAYKEKWYYFSQKLEKDPDLQQDIADALVKLIDSPEVKNFLENIWHTFQTWFKEDLAAKDGQSIYHLHQFFLKVSQDLLNKPETILLLNQKLVHFTEATVARYRSLAAQYVEESVKSWNSSELLRKLELNIGKDLQYIRINGALVGGIVGLMISTLATFLHQFGFY